MSDLADLFNTYGSDKDRNGYSSLYFTLFDKLKNDSLTLLEIGIGTMIPGVHSSMVGYSLPGYAPGGSLRAWKDYFPNGRIIGADVQPDTQFVEDRIETYICDSTNTSDTESFICTVKCSFDIIIDDGSHMAENQFKTLENLWKYLNVGGIYVIEDIFPGSDVSVNHQRIKSITGGSPYFFSGLKNNLCIIYKKPLNYKNIS